jgi:hypothetical protein
VAIRIDALRDELARDGDKLLAASEIAYRLDISESQLQAYRSDKGNDVGPPWMRLAGKVRYSLAAALAWIEDCRRATVRDRGRGKVTVNTSGQPKPAPRAYLWTGPRRATVVQMNGAPYWQDLLPGAPIENIPLDECRHWAACGLARLETQREADQRQAMGRPWLM